MIELDDMIRQGLRQATDPVGGVDREHVAELLRSSQPSSRSTRRRLLGVAAVVVFIVLSVGALVIASRVSEDHLVTDEVPASTWTSRSPLRAEIAIDPYVESGTSQSGTVIVNNDTGQPIDGYRCGVAYTMSLHGEAYSGDDMQPACKGKFTVPIGESRWPVELSGVASGCSDDPNATRTRELLRCPPGGGPAPIPPGSYRAVVHGPDGFPLPDSFEVRVGEPGEPHTDMVPPYTESGAATSTDGFVPGQPIPVISASNQNGYVAWDDMMGPKRPDFAPIRDKPGGSVIGFWVVNRGWVTWAEAIAANYSIDKLSPAG